MADDLEIDNLPNRLTIFRMAMIPVVIGMLYGANYSALNDPKLSSILNWGACWIFVIASITDFFDGYIARKRNIQTVFGSFLDPIADKFLVVSGLIVLGEFGRVEGPIVIILVLREMYMTSLRLLAINEGIKVPVNNQGKWKTGFQMTALPMLMANESWWFFDFPLIGKICIYVASFLSLQSAVTYSAGLIRKLKIKRALKKRAHQNQIN